MLKAFLCAVIGHKIRFTAHLMNCERCGKRASLYQRHNAPMRWQ